MDLVGWVFSSISKIISGHTGKLLVEIYMT